MTKPSYKSLLATLVITDALVPSLTETPAETNPHHVGDKDKLNFVLDHLAGEISKEAFLSSWIVRARTYGPRNRLLEQSQIRLRPRVPTITV